MTVDHGASSPAACPQCGYTTGGYTTGRYTTGGYTTGLTSPPRVVPHTGGRVHVHTRNGAAIVRRVKTTQDHVTDRITAFAGSLSFVYIHSVWFLLWILANVGLIGASAEFDPFPFGLLTLIVSLEAIFLSTFVMVSQNRQAARSDLQAELDFETNLRSEIWTLQIGHRLGLDPAEIERHVQDAIAASNASLASGQTPEPHTPSSEAVSPVGRQL